MRLALQITGFILLPVAALLGYTAAQLPYATVMGPGPGFFPLWLCGLLALLAIIMIAQATFGWSPPLPADFFPERSGYLRIIAAIAGLLGIAAGMSQLGFPITAFVFYLVLLTVFGRRNPIEIVVLAAIGSFGVYYLFTKLLSQPLPPGLFSW
ncbi:tripartite tricarboxylate transporter TctB family protein [Chelatococcus sp. GCM10030263]|uniref:tripartite tricarboxylate transporter TctB family protein n=1 Tax=Chelatococcus sp. GCM10030263 TaxID=3273387 RepID=UPI0036210F2C